MPILKNAKKALRRDLRRTDINIVTKDKMKAAVKAVREKKDPKLLPAAYSAIDRAVKRYLLPQNKAAHMKAQLAIILKKAAAPAPAKAAKPVKKASKATKPVAKKVPVKKAATKKKASQTKVSKAKKSSK